jgi:phosphatidylserine/phosphatidylglycerophosphate/cardiolipin synthase-like enzyme
MQFGSIRAVAAPYLHGDDEGWLREGDTCWRVAAAERAAFLIDGESFFAALAAALERARHQVLMLGWDFHGRVRLRRDGARRRLPDELHALLGALLERRPELRVHALGWGYGVVRALARELLPALHLGLRTHRRLEFRLDTSHPLLACHHQKVIVVDDGVAFVGGFDVTACRWDSRAHRRGDPRRTAPHGAPYEAFHDVQMAVGGAAAAALGTLARERWHRATGAALPAPPPRDDSAWPPALEPSLRGAQVGVARTEPGDRSRAPVREVEALYLASLAGARRWIYAESQYLTSERVVAALAARLAEADGPEVVLVLPRRCPAWVEEATMGPLRARAIAALRAADRRGRLRLYYPQLGRGRPLHVHSKVMVVDDRLARIGSSNLSNRSLSLDTECDLAIESGGRGDLARAIGGLRDDLLAEHLGVPQARFREALERRGSLIAAVEALRGGERTLQPLPEGAPGLWAALAPGLADPASAGSQLPRCLGLVAALLVLLGLAGLVAG